MRFTTIIWIVLLLIPLASAAPDVVFDKSISHGHKITLNDSIYEVQIGEGNHSLVKLVSSFETINVESGDCIERFYDKFCYKEYVEDQKIEANLTDYKPIIEIDRDITSKKLDLGEESTITVTFENTGGTEIKDFVFIETIPSMLTIMSTDGCTVSKDNDQQIIFEEKLYEDTPVVCEYVVRAGDVGLAVYEGKIYTDMLASSQDADAVPQVAITTKNVFNFEVASSDYNLEVGQPFILTFDIENIKTDSNGDNLSIDEVIIYLDDELAIKQMYESSFSYFSTSQKFKFSGTIPPETTWQQKVELQSLLLDDNITVNIFVKYTLGTATQKSFQQSVQLNQSFIPLYCQYLVVDDAGNNLISLDKLNHTLPGYDQGELLVYVYNDNYYVSIDNIKSSPSGDIQFESDYISSLRKNDDEILSSALFSFNKLDAFPIKSDIAIKYDVFDEKFETSCNGNILVEKPTFLDINKELSFLNISVDDETTKLIPHVKFSLQNEFFLPITDIEVVEVLPANVFSNNNTRKSFSLGVLDEGTFEFDFIVPLDYVSLDGEEIILNTDISYSIYGTEFNELIPLSINANDVISAQQGVLIDSLIDAKVKQLTQELNESLVKEQEQQTINESQVPIVTYSPFLDYFSIALFVFLFLLALVFLNIRYGLSTIIKKWFVTKKIKKIAKDEESFAKKYESYKLQEGSYLEKLQKGKKVLRAVESVYKKQKKSFKHAIKLIKSQEMKSNMLLEKEHHSIQSLENKKASLEAKIALINREIMAQEQKKEQLSINRNEEKSLLEKKKTDVLKAKEFISTTQSKIKKLDAYLDTMKSDFEKSYTKNKEVLDVKLTKVKGDLSHLDEEYEAKRKLLKEEEKHLEQRES